MLIGSDLSNLNLNLQDNSSAFSIDINPKAGWFFKDNRLLGAEFNLDLTTQKNATITRYGAGLFARYYLGSQTTYLIRMTKFFGEINAGIFGTNTSGSGTSNSSTNGLGIGLGPGVSYFISPNIALELLAKYNLTVGFGNSTTNNTITAALGFQIFIPGRRLRNSTTPKDIGQ